MRASPTWTFGDQEELSPLSRADRCSWATARLETQAVGPAQRKSGCSESTPGKTGPDHPEAWTGNGAHGSRSGQQHRRCTGMLRSFHDCLLARHRWPREPWNPAGVASVFIARPARPIKIYSDNGNTFVGAVKLLKLRSDGRLQTYLAEEATAGNSTWAEYISGANSLSNWSASFKTVGRSTDLCGAVRSGSGGGSPTQPSSTILRGKRRAAADPDAGKLIVSALQLSAWTRTLARRCKPVQTSQVLADLQGRPVETLDTGIPGNPERATSWQSRRQICIPADWRCGYRAKRGDE